jgi:subtilisin family serine protease
MADNEPKKPVDRARENMGFGPSQTRGSTIPPLLRDGKQRAELDLPEDPAVPGTYMIELNLDYHGGWKEAAKEFLELYKLELGPAEAEKRPAIYISKNYYRCLISANEWTKLVHADEARGAKNDRLIYKIWPDFKLKPLIDRSIATVKADAAYRSYSANGDRVVWAVIDSGIDGSHRHFKHYETLVHVTVADLHRDFTRPGDPDKTTAATALADQYGHGTHVAGIIAGGLGPDTKETDYRVYEGHFTASADGTHQKSVQQRKLDNPEQLRGVAPQCRLVSLKVLDDNGDGNASDIIRAMRYIREDVNGDPKLLRIHGVNISVGYDFDAEMFACGQSPLCVEVDRLVKSGVVVVVAAGNTGYGKVFAEERGAKAGLSNTINDPGNATLAITVGATHRDMPHTYGVSYFSSKGPTGDGRLKPDLVAPGERITSCAAGALLQGNGGPIATPPCAYIDDSGTSMAAPHVSGAIAAFLSIRREFIQRPEDVKRIFLDSATPLGRERYFEGRGLVDLMRAIQSV